MRVPLVQVDAFTDRPFAGNPAAVVRLGAWLPDEVLQAIAQEMNLSETAFVVRDAAGWDLRWFTPTTEVDLCGHATLAAAHVLLEDEARGEDEVVFRTRSGDLAVARGEGGRLVLDLPRRAPTEAEAPPGLVEALGRPPEATLRSTRDWLCVYPAEADVRALRPDRAGLLGLEGGVIATAPADAEGVDFVSRFFAPAVGVDEDPVTGSAHCVLAPYWAARLGRPRLEARQISARGGALVCEDGPERVRVAGHARRVLEGTLILEEGGSDG